DLIVKELTKSREEHITEEAHDLQKSSKYEKVQKSSFVHSFFKFIIKMVIGVKFSALDTALQKAASHIRELQRKVPETLKNTQLESALHDARKMHQPTLESIQDLQKKIDDERARL
ncbi:MAG TPA: hypothetical protein VN457_07245, partial [Chlamydiales bacterium]|nr:hypothetical protein [Chlamydiales bacterium]